MCEYMENTFAGRTAIEYVCRSNEPDSSFVGLTVGNQTRSKARGTVPEA